MGLYKRRAEYSEWPDGRRSFPVNERLFQSAQTQMQ